MEFRLNKVDVEIRDKIKDKTHDKKVNTKEKAVIETKSYENKDDNNSNFKGMEDKEKISINAYKDLEEKIDVSLYNDEVLKGSLIDKKR